MLLKFRILLFSIAVLTILFWQRAAFAQASLLVVPNYSTNSQVPNAAEAMFISIGREQTVFSASEFPPYPLVISEIQWRPDVFGGPIANCTISNIQINLSTTTRNVDQLSSVFDDNTGTNDTVVFNGALILNTSFTTLSNGTKAFDINVPLQTSFTYDPSQGNLLIELRNRTGGTANLYDNSTQSGSDAVSRIFANGDANATSAGTVDTGGGVIQITYTTLSSPPAIIDQPTNQNAVINGSATFTVTTIGSIPIYYQWFFNDLTNPIAGATNTSLILVNAQTNQEGIYFVQVTNAYGTTLSSNALLTVTTLPVINSQPTNQTALPGETATFAVTVESGVPVTYQWYFNNTNLVAGATNASLVITNVQFNNIGLYSVRTINSYGSVISSNALLTIGLIVPNYSASNQIHGADGSFNSITRQETVYAASEFPPYPIVISEIRLRPDIDAGGPLSITLPNAQFSFSTTQAKPDQLSSTFSQNIGTNYTVVFSGALSISTTFTTLSNGTKALDIRIPFQTPFLYNPSEGNLLLDFRNFNGCTPPVGNFMNIAGGTDGTSRLYTSDPNGTSGFGDTGGYVLEIAYNPAPVPPTITVQPTNRLIAAGTTTTFAMMASAPQPLSYQWFFNDFDHPLNFETNSSLTLVNVQTNQSGNYFVQVTDSYGSVQSFPTLLTVFPGPLIISQPVSQAVTAGGTAIFAVTAQGAPLSYQWFFNNTNLLLDATNASLNVTNVQANLLGLYSVRVADIYGSANSANASLNIGLIAPNYATSYQLNNSGENIFIGTVREQTVYGASQFPSYPIVITELRWRPDSIAVGPLTDNVPNIQINLSMTTTNADHMSSTFSKNVGTNDTVVFSGTMTALTSFTTLSNGTKAFDIFLPLQTSFIFDPSKGNLLVDLRNFSGGSANLYNNSVSTSTDVVSRVFNAGNPNATFATSGDTGGGAMQVIYTPAPLPPTISSQPTNRSVLIGSSTSFDVGAGPLPLVYQWFYNTNTPLAGATNSSLVLTNLQMGQAGTYSVVVSNDYGPTASSFAVLTLNFPPVNVFTGSTNVMGGNSFTIPVLIAANGNENTVSFSMNFNTQQVTFASVDLGSGAADGSLLLNTSQVNSGRLGITMQLPAGETFAPGTQEVVRVTFLSAFVTGTQVVTPINFTNQPINRFVFDAQNNKLATNFINGSVTLGVTDFEGDVTPRQTGDHNLDIFDWTQVGRFVAGLDVITNAAEFQRADVAPKSTAGDGQLKVTDWVQAGRYGAVIDAPAVVGGPTSPVTPTTLTGGPRTVNIATTNGVKGLNFTVPVILQSQGNENGVGFSVNFNPTVLKYISTAKGGADASGTLLVNTNQAASGTVGVLVALQAGNSFTNGAQQEIAKLTFTALNTMSNGVVAFTNGPVLLAISDPVANELAANYLNGALTINPPPSLTATIAGGNATLSWPVWGTGFNVQATSNLLTQGWTNISYSAQTNGSNIIITIPMPAQGGYFRLQHP